MKEAHSPLGYTQANAFASVITPVTGKPLLLRGFRGHEAISECFDIELDLFSEDNGIDFAQVIGKPATIRMETGGGARYLHGVITEFRQGASDPRFTDYRARLRPRLWLLSLTSDCRIFQNQKAPAIIQSVLGDHGVSDVDVRLSRTYPSREYCVQYNESALAFVSRLMEEEGIFYFFKHEEDKHTLVLSDDAKHYDDCPVAKGEVAYVPEGLRGVSSEDSVVDCQLSQQVVQESQSLGDYSFQTPGNILLANVARGQGRHEVYQYPGNYAQRAAGEQTAGRRLDALGAEEKRLIGESLCRGFVTGHGFTLSNHQRADMNAGYTLLRLDHHCEASIYRNSFEALPMKVTYRPPLRTPRPRIAGGQTARVVGPSSEKEVWTDSYGRIKVQFHWDREGKNDDNSSCWIRVSQPTAGNGWGTVFLPRVGQEVVVTFLEGDPDRPLVTGTVYNGGHDAPYALPANRTRSTIKTKTFDGDGFNELSFDDKAGEEEVYLHAEKDMNLEVKNDRTKTVEGKETNTITKDRTTTVKEGNESLTVTKGDRTVKVETGKETHEVKGTRGLTVTGKETHTNKADFTQDVGGNYTLTVKGNLTIDVTGSITLKSGTSLSAKSGVGTALEAGTSFNAKAGTTLTNEAAISLTNKAGASITSQASGNNEIKGAMVTVSGSMVKLG